MPDIVQDPTGLEVVLTDECWRHVISHHVEMVPFKEFVLESIGNLMAFISERETRPGEFIGGVIWKFQESGIHWIFSFFWEMTENTSQRRISQLSPGEC